MLNKFFKGKEDKVFAESEILTWFEPYTLDLENLTYQEYVTVYRNTDLSATDMLTRDEFGKLKSLTLKMLAAEKNGDKTGLGFAPVIPSRGWVPPPSGNGPASPTASGIPDGYREFSDITRNANKAFTEANPFSNGIKGGAGQVVGNYAANLLKDVIIRNGGRIPPGLFSNGQSALSEEIVSRNHLPKKHSLSSGLRYRGDAETELYYHKIHGSTPVKFIHGYWDLWNVSSLKQWYVSNLWNQLRKAADINLKYNTAGKLYLQDGKLLEYITKVSHAIQVYQSQTAIINVGHRTSCHNSCFKFLASRVKYAHHEGLELLRRELETFAFEPTLRCDLAALMAPYAEENLPNATVNMVVPYQFDTATDINGNTVNTLPIKPVMDCYKDLTGMDKAVKDAIVKVLDKWVPKEGTFMGNTSEVLFDPIFNDLWVNLYVEYTSNGVTYQQESCAEAFAPAHYVTRTNKEDGIILALASPTITGDGNSTSFKPILQDTTDVVNATATVSSNYTYWINDPTGPFYYGYLGSCFNDPAMRMSGNLKQMPDINIVLADHNQSVLKMLNVKPHGCQLCTSVSNETCKKSLEDYLLERFTKKLSIGTGRTNSGNPN